MKTRCFFIITGCILHLSAPGQNLLLNGSFELGTTVLGGENNYFPCDYTTYTHCFVDCPNWDHASAVEDCWVGGNGNPDCKVHSPDHGGIPGFYPTYHGDKSVFMGSFEQINQSNENLLLGEDVCYDIRLKFRQSVSGNYDNPACWEYEFRFYHSDEVFDYQSDANAIYDPGLGIAIPNPDYGRYTNSAELIGEYPLAFLREYRWTEERRLSDTLGVGGSSWLDMNLTFFTDYAGIQDYDRFAIDIKDIDFDAIYTAGGFGCVGVLIDEVELVPSCQPVYVIDGLGYGGIWNYNDPIRARDYIIMGDLTTKGWTTFARRSKTQFTAGHSIIFEPGTYTDIGSVVYAHIEECVGCRGGQTVGESEPDYYSPGEEVYEDDEARNGTVQSDRYKEAADHQSLFDLLSDERSKIHSVRVTNMAGQTLLLETMLHPDRLRAMSPGLYVITIRYEDGSVKVKKFVIVR